MPLNKETNQPTNTHTLQYPLFLTNHLSHIWPDSSMNFTCQYVSVMQLRVGQNLHRLFIQKHFFTVYSVYSFKVACIV